MGQITHPTLGSPMAMVTPDAELVVVGSRSIDVHTNSNISIEYEHHKIHNGDHYFYRNWTTIASSGGSILLIFKTPDTASFTHLQFDIYSNNLVDVVSYEDVSISGGTTLDVLNNNRNESNNYTGSLIFNPEITDSGIQMSRLFIGEAGVNPNQQGLVGQRGRENELILKSGTAYAWVFNAGGNDTKIGFVGNWYENIDK